MGGRPVVMISSTARDLPAHRHEARIACERAGFEPREMMENLTAVDAGAIEASLRMVDQADVYVGILAYRYGYIPDGHDISITEMEYNRAVELKKLRLLFLIHDNHLVTKKDFDTGASAVKLEELKVRVQKERVVQYFKSPEDLRGHIVEALSLLARTLDAESRDANARAIAKLHRKSAIPEPPAPDMVHPYTLMEVRDLVGRHAELNAMTDWVATPASESFQRPIFCFVAIGGMGKSAVTWNWFNRIAPQEMKTLVGRLWWSFYESDASFETFMVRALCYVSGMGKEEARTLPWSEKEEHLLHHLDERPFLFALDGLERILIAYSRADASHLADEELEAEKGNSETKCVSLPSAFGVPHRLRRTIDPRAAAFLRKLTQVRSSRILISTRLYPADLETSNGSHHPKCHPYLLRGLSDDDALTLWRCQGVTGSRTELMPIFRSIENHPLLIQALASTIAAYRRVPGDFAAWRAEHSHFDPTALPLVQSRSHILAYALDGLSRPVREVLHTLVGFRMPASYTTLEALLVGEHKTYQTAQRLDLALTELEDRGLIGWDRIANRYDAHPIVRGVVWRQTNVNDQCAVCKAIEAHFRPMVTPDWRVVSSLDDLTPAIERYHVLIGLDRQDDAFQLFNDRLALATDYRLAAHRQRIDWLEQLFPNGVNNASTIRNKVSERNALGALATSYQMCGYLSLSISLWRRIISMVDAPMDSEIEMATFGNLGKGLRLSGAIREATSATCRAFQSCRNSANKFVERWLLMEFAHIFGSRGDYQLARLMFERSRLMQFDSPHVGVSQWQAAALAGISHQALSVGLIDRAHLLAERAWDVAQGERNELNCIEIMTLRGRIALARRDFGQAGNLLHLALARARAVSIVANEIEILSSLADLECQQRNHSCARIHAQEALEAADVGPWPLHSALAHNVLADIAREEGKYTEAIDAAAAAYRGAWCDGPPYAYHAILKKAKAQLAALGAAEPAMEPFDEAKFEPLPEFEFNPRDEYWIDPTMLD